MDDYLVLRSFSSQSLQYMTIGVNMFRSRVYLFAGISAMGLSLIVLVLAVTPSSAQDMFAQQARLTSGNTGDNYANIGVGISGDTAVVGSDGGVYVYIRSGATWS